MSLVEHSNQLRKRGKPEARAFPSVRMQRRKPRTSSHTHTRFRNWCSNCVRARAADCKEPEIPLTMADYCYVQDAPGKELFTILDMLDIALGMMAATSVQDNRPATYVVSAVVEQLRAWGRKKVIFRIGGEPAIRTLGVAMQYARSDETVIECEI